VPLVPAPLDLGGDVFELLRTLIDIESVSGHETEIADRVAEALGGYGHLEVVRDGNVVIARTELGRSERVAEPVT
jgi:succinyl-diaminopimelate desuccinylase